MKQVGRLLFMVAVMSLAAGPGMAGDPVALAGSYHWERGEESVDGTLEVEMTATGEGTWDIAFRFDWEGEPHVFEGKAKGSLSGELTGNVDSDDPGHPLKFEFTGAFSDGAFAGTHGYFNREGELVPSGTLELAAAG